MVDYIFGRGVSGALPREGMRLTYSRRSGRVKLVHHKDKLFATMRPNGSMALSLYGATLLSKSRQFRHNCITVDDEGAPFVKGGKSVFCKFVTKAGREVRPRGDVAILDSSGRLIGVGTSVLAGSVVQQFKSGVAVKVREGFES